MKIINDISNDYTVDVGLLSVYARQWRRRNDERWRTGRSQLRLVHGRPAWVPWGALASRLLKLWLRSLWNFISKALYINPTSQCLINMYLPQSTFSLIYRYKFFLYIYQCYHHFIYASIYLSVYLSMLFCKLLSSLFLSGLAIYIYWFFSPSLYHNRSSSFAFPNLKIIFIVIHKVYVNQWTRRNAWSWTRLKFASPSNSLAKEWRRKVKLVPSLCYLCLRFMCIVSEKFS